MEFFTESGQFQMEHDNLERIFSILPTNPFQQYYPLIKDIYGLKLPKLLFAIKALPLAFSLASYMHPAKWHAKLLIALEQ